MNKQISNDLKSLSEVIERHYISIGIDKAEAMKNVAELTKKIGQEFNGDRLYISFNTSKEARKQKIMNAIKRGLTTYREIADFTGIPKSEVHRIASNISAHKNNQ